MNLSRENQERIKQTEYVMESGSHEVARRCS